MTRMSAFGKKQPKLWTSTCLGPVFARRCERQPRQTVIPVSDAKLLHLWPLVWGASSRRLTDLAAWPSRADSNALGRDSSLHKAIATSPY